MELHILGDEPVGSHDNVHTAAANFLDDILLLRRRLEAGQHFYVHREAVEALHDGVVVLEGEDGRGHQESTLLSVGNALECGTEGDFGFAEPYIATEEAIHGVWFLHVLLDFLNAAQLILGLVVLKAALKVALHVNVRREGIALRVHPLSVELRELLGNVLDRAAHLGPGLLPFLAPQAIDLHCMGLFSGPNIFGDQVELSDGDVECIALGVADLDEVLRDPRDGQVFYALEHADTMDAVDYVVPLMELIQAVERIGRLRAADLAAGARGHTAMTHQEKPRLGE